LPRSAPDHLAVIQPPTATCLTARRRLRADRLPTFALSRSGLGHQERRSFLGCRRLRRIEPSDTSHQRPIRGRVSALEPIAWDSLPAGHVNAPTFRTACCLTCCAPRWLRWPLRRVLTYRSTLRALLAAASPSGLLATIIQQAPEPEVPSAEEDVAGGPFEHRAVRCRRWPAGQPPHVFIDVRKNLD
jgi:hypothetical protein